MMKQNSHDELLEELAKRTGTMYLSDLSFQIQTERLRQAIMNIPEAKYNVDEWHEAIRYIVYHLDLHIREFHSVAEAKKFLLNLKV